ncbi:MAG: hypothetical protein KAI83_17050, partial [Thiomargarita sp.]|nr:hypothetical protein [Thiomargarita sp.]
VGCTIDLRIEIFVFFASNASTLENFGVQRFSFGKLWSPTLQLWKIKVLKLMLHYFNSPKLKRWTPEQY